eukprot:2567626-Prymnesium_polylepis.2
MHDETFQELGKQAWTYAYDGKTGELEHLMRVNSDVRVEKYIHPEFGSSPLHAACESRNETDGCVRLLVDADMRREPGKRHPSHHLTHVINLQWANQGITLHSLRESKKFAADGGTPLFIAALRGKATAMHILLKAGANATTPNVEECAPLLVCIEQPSEGDGQCLWMLLRNRTPDMFPDFVSVLANARKTKQATVVQILEDAAGR